MRDREAAALLEILPVPVRIFDSDGVLLRRNAIADADDANMRGVTLRDFWERDQPRRAEGNTQIPFDDWAGARALAGEVVRAQAMIVVRRYLRLPVAVSAAPVLDEHDDVTGVILTELQITSTGAESETDNDARLRDQRLAAIGQLAAGVMHDVNNALNPIMQAAYLLRTQAGNPEAVLDYAERIRIAAETGAATASRVGRFIRQEPSAGILESIVELGEALDEALLIAFPVQGVEASQRRRIRIEQQREPHVTIRANPAELREAILNVLQNALHAMPDGGTLTARTFIADGTAGIEIRDTGQGMTTEVRNRAFEPFFSTKGAGGTGLGLSEVYGIARRHGGNAAIESKHGDGTSVTLTFPLERSAPPPLENVAERSAPLHLLIVEDHDEGREFLRRLLTSEGHSVDAVRTCRDARDRLEKEDVRYDVMVTDVGLPDGSGWDLVAHARGRLPALRIGVITGWEPSAHSSDSRGAEFVLRKPLRAAELLAHIASRDD